MPEEDDKKTLLLTGEPLEAFLGRRDPPMGNDSNVYIDLHRTFDQWYRQPNDKEDRLEKIHLTCFQVDKDSSEYPHLQANSDRERTEMVNSLNVTETMSRLKDFIKKHILFKFEAEENKKDTLANYLVYWTPQLGFQATMAAIRYHAGKIPDDPKHGLSNCVIQQPDHKVILIPTNEGVRAHVVMNVVSYIVEQNDGSTSVNRKKYQSDFGEETTLDETLELNDAALGTMNLTIDFSVTSNGTPKVDYVYFTAEYTDDTSYVPESSPKVEHSLLFSARIIETLNKNQPELEISVLALARDVITIYEYMKAYFENSNRDRSNDCYVPSSYFLTEHKTFIDSLKDGISTKKNESLRMYPRKILSYIQNSTFVLDLQTLLSCEYFYGNPNKTTFSRMQRQILSLYNNAQKIFPLLQLDTMPTFEFNLDPYKKLYDIAKLNQKEVQKSKHDDGLRSQLNRGAHQAFQTQKVSEKPETYLNEIQALSSISILDRNPQSPIAQCRKIESDMADATIELSKEQKDIYLSRIVAIAKHLTALQADIMRKIKWKDIAEYIATGNNPQYIAYDNYTHCIGGMLLNDVTTSKAPSLSIDRWHLIANYCLAQNDFQTAYAIFQGLKNDDIFLISNAQQKEMALLSQKSVFNAFTDRALEGSAFTTSLEDINDVIEFEEFQLPSKLTLRFLIQLDAHPEWLTTSNISGDPAFQEDILKFFETNERTYAEKYQGLNSRDLSARFQNFIKYLRKANYRNFPYHAEHICPDLTEETEYFCILLRDRIFYKMYNKIHPRKTFRSNDGVEKTLERVIFEKSSLDRQESGRGITDVIAKIDQKALEWRAILESHGLEYIPEEQIKSLKRAIYRLGYTNGSLNDISLKEQDSIVGEIYPNSDLDAFDTWFRKNVTNFRFPRMEDSRERSIPYKSLTLEKFEIAFDSVTQQKILQNQLIVLAANLQRLLKTKEANPNAVHPEDVEEEKKNYRLIKTIGKKLAKLDNYKKPTKVYVEGILSDDSLTARQKIDNLEIKIKAFEAERKALPPITNRDSTLRKKYARQFSKKGDLRLVLRSGKKPDEWLQAQILKIKCAPKPTQAMLRLADYLEHFRTERRLKKCQHIVEKGLLRSREGIAKDTVNDFKHYYQKNVGGDELTMTRVLQNHFLQDELKKNSQSKSVYLNYLEAIAHHFSSLGDEYFNTSSRKDALKHLIQFDILGSTSRRHAMFKWYQIGYFWYAHGRSHLFAIFLEAVNTPPFNTFLSKNDHNYFMKQFSHLTPMPHQPYMNKTAPPLTPLLEAFENFDTHPEGILSDEENPFVAYLAEYIRNSEKKLTLAELYQRFCDEVYADHKVQTHSVQTNKNEFPFQLSYLVPHARTRIYNQAKSIRDFEENLPRDIQARYDSQKLPFTLETSDLSEEELHIEGCAQDDVVKKFTASSEETNDAVEAIARPEYIDVKHKIAGSPNTAAMEMIHTFIQHLDPALADGSVYYIETTSEANVIKMLEAFYQYEKAMQKEQPFHIGVVIKENKPFMPIESIQALKIPVKYQNLIRAGLRPETISKKSASPDNTLSTFEKVSGFFGKRKAITDMADAETLAKRAKKNAFPKPKAGD